MVLFRHNLPQPIQAQLMKLKFTLQHSPDDGPGEKIWCILKVNFNFNRSEETVLEFGAGEVQFPRCASGCVGVCGQLEKFILKPVCFIAVEVWCGTDWQRVSGASEGILAWYGQPSEVQFTRGGVVAESKILEI